MLMRRRGWQLLVGLVMIALLGVCWRLSLPGVPRSPPVRLTFVGFTNGPAGQRVAVFNLSNSYTKPVLFASGVLIETDGSGPPMWFPPDKRCYQPWTGNPPERPASALVAGSSTTFQTTLPKSGSAWMERIIWQLKPTKMQYAYAAVLDNVLTFLHRQSYPFGRRPSARIWREILISSDMIHSPSAEPGAAPNGGFASPVGNREPVEGRHR
jgi:hypothetical protein